MFLASIIHEGSTASYRYRYRYRLLLDPSDITVPPTYGKSNGSYSGDAGFDSNMVIILAALLCALLCALGLNSCVRCFLQCSTTYGGGGRETADEVAARLAATGIKEALSRIPAVVYEAVLHVPATDCPICLGEFVEGEDVRFFPRCNHGFHVKCIDRWLVLHSSCPTCRQPLIGHSVNSSTDHVRIQIS